MGPRTTAKCWGGGAHRLVQYLGERLEDCIHLNAPVTEIAQNDHGVRVVSGQTEITASYAVVAMPPTMAGRMTYHPAMPPERDQLTQRMPIRGKIVAALLYDTPFWRADGHRLIETDKLLFWDEGGSQVPAALSGLISIDWSRELWRLPEADRRDAIIGELAKTLGPQCHHPSHFFELYWAAEPWTRGCNSFLTTGTWTTVGHTLRAPVGRIHWAGAEISPQFIGQMEGRHKVSRGSRGCNCGATAIGLRRTSKRAQSQWAPQGVHAGQGRDHVFTVVKNFMASSTPSFTPLPESLMPPKGDISIR